MIVELIVVIDRNYVLKVVSIERKEEIMMSCVSHTLIENQLPILYVYLDNIHVYMQ